MKNKWIYLKSKFASDAIALATVLSYSGEFYNIVRTSFQWQYLSKLKNVNIDFYHQSDNENLCILDNIAGDSFLQKCQNIAEIIGINLPESIEMINFSTEHRTFLINRLLEKEFILLYFFKNMTSPNVVIIDRAIHILSTQENIFISGGNYMFPNIKDTLDYRQLINLSTIYELKDKIKYIITSEHDILIIGEAFNIPVFVISYDDESMKIDNQIISDANQLVNYITINIHNYGRK